MKKFLLLAISVLLVCGVVNIAKADLVTSNLLANPGFETHIGNDFANWAEGGASVQAVAVPVHGGTSAAFLGASTENLFQTFALPSSVDTLLFGAYFKIYAPTLSGNWDQAQINMQVTGDGGLTIGGAIQDINTLNPGLFTWNASLQNWESAWFLVYGIIDTSAIGSTTADINISLQDYSATTPYLTKLFVDDAFAGAPVPEPGTMMLLGSGLAGLVGYGRKRFKK